MCGVGNDFSSNTDDERKVDSSGDVKSGDRESRQRDGDGTLASRLTLVPVRALPANNFFKLGDVVHTLSRSLIEDTSVVLGEGRRGEKLTM